MPLMPILLAIALPQAGAAESEWIGLPPTPGLVVAHRQRVANAAISERVPAGETVNDWTRMVTVIRIARSGPRPDALAYGQTMRARWLAACPGGRVWPPPPVRLTPRDPVVGRYDCPLNPATGKPETMFMRTQAGDDALHIVQVAFRRVATRDDMEWADALLAGVWLCRQGMAPLACAPENRGL